MDDEREIDEVKKLPKKILIFFTLLILLFLFGSVTFMVLDGISFSKGFRKTIESSAFLFQEENNFSKYMQIFFSIWGVCILWWILWTFLDMLMDGKIGQYLKMTKYKSIIRRMKNHYIIAGGGRVGEEIARDLERLKKNFVIIEKDPVKVLKLRRKGYVVIEGDANDVESQILAKANIKEAGVLIIAMPETEKNLLLTLMAKEMKPELDIYVRCDHPEFVSRLKKAGAKSVIVPEIIAADQFVKEIFG